VSKSANLLYARKIAWYRLGKLEKVPISDALPLEAASPISVLGFNHELLVLKHIIHP